ncbi:uncharacterized protein LOC128228696 [Mya arenaria]|uniref:uncharacterized protein LOC128228696 n=1 Tax=Mya arenaria TaxID=6604 RepID=UPI0022E67EA0|nr:uncharacterized protein LOC128228696 [Mya arenaria]XP_052796122.1 uncharacterized protein LOC128228696 [Mya arenaria]
MTSNRSTLSLAIVVVVIIGLAGGVEFAYVKESESTINEVTEVLHIGDCITASKAEASRLGYLSGELHYAVTWISMYSRICHINETLLSKDTDTSNFSFHLNKELRCSFHLERYTTTGQTFKRAAHVISNSLYMIGFQKYNSLFRGVNNFNYRNRSYFIEYGFFSASRSLRVALRFADGGTVLIFKDMNGVPISNFAQDRFEYQQDVLGPPNSTFLIDAVTKDKTTISNALKPYPIWSDVKVPTEIIYLTYIADDNEKAEAMKQVRPDLPTHFCSFGIPTFRNCCDKPSLAFSTILQITTIVHFIVSKMMVH